jgi:hypothetical protein
MTAWESDHAEAMKKSGEISGKAVFVQYALKQACIALDASKKSGEISGKAVFVQYALIALDASTQIRHWP